MQSSQLVQEYELNDLDITLLGEEGAEDIGKYIFRGVIKKDTYCVELIYVNKQGVIYRLRISTIIDIIRYIYFVAVDASTDYWDWLRVLSSEVYPLIGDMRLTYEQVVIPALSDMKMKRLRIYDAIAKKSSPLFSSLGAVDYSYDPFFTSDDYCRPYIMLTQLSIPPTNTVDAANTANDVTMSDEVCATNSVASSSSKCSTDVIQVSATFLDEHAEELAKLRAEIEVLKSQLKAARDILNQQYPVEFL
jgi:hypothetical protein